jgi:hypothetical protein
VKTTNAWRSSGWNPIKCSLQGEPEPSLHEYAQCNPYRDGNIVDPNNYVDSEGEFNRLCGSLGDDGLIPEGAAVGTLIVSAPSPLATPVIVIRNYAALWENPAYANTERADVASAIKVEAYALETPISLALACNDGMLQSTDILVMPAGNLDVVLTTAASFEMDLLVRNCPGSCEWYPIHERVVDVDEFVPWFGREYLLEEGP